MASGIFNGEIHVAEKLLKAPLRSSHAVVYYFNIFSSTFVNFLISTFRQGQIINKSFSSSLLSIEKERLKATKLNKFPCIMLFGNKKVFILNLIEFHPNQMLKAFHSLESFYSTTLHVFNRIIPSMQTQNL